ncbi:MAG TPA: hypothetical protein PKA37_02185 [Planctomycetota bacterium]|jgi:hypothetical protein|nr:hypothetical protein [Planctomycetota bacterium]
MSNETETPKATFIGTVFAIIGVAIINGATFMYAGVVLFSGAQDEVLTVLKLVPVGLVAILQPWGLALWWLSQHEGLTFVLGTLISAVIYRYLWDARKLRIHRARQSRLQELPENSDHEQQAVVPSTRPPSGRLWKRALLALCVVYFALVMARGLDFPVADRSVPGMIQQQMKRHGIPVRGSCTREFRNVLISQVIWCGEMSREAAEQISEGLGLTDVPHELASSRFRHHGPWWWDPPMRDMTWFRAERFEAWDADADQFILAYSESKGKLYYWFYDGF